MGNPKDITTHPCDQADSVTEDSPAENRYTFFSASFVWVQRIKAF